MIIDSHVHACGLPYNQEKLSFYVFDGRVIPFGLSREDCSVDRLLEDMDECDVEMAFVNVLEGWTSNEDVSNMVKKHPKRLLGFAWVSNPKNEEESIKQLDHAIKKLDLKGLKLHPGLQGFSPADPEILPLISHAASLDAPVFIHAVPWPPGTFHLNLPEHIDTLKTRVPDAKIIIGHMAGQRFLDLLSLIDLPEVYVETSFTLNLITELWGLGFATRFIRKLGTDKILFGSDWVGNIDQIKAYNLNIIDNMDLKREEKEQILGENARKLMKL